MQVTELAATYGIVTAIVIDAVGSLWPDIITELILPEVQSFSWVNLVADRVVEIVVRYFAIVVDVEHLVNLIKFLITHSQSPVVEVELQFALRDAIRVYVLVHILECFRYGLPLHPHLIYHQVFQSFDVHFINLVIQVAHQVFRFYQVFLKLWVSLGIMTEVEAGALVNTITEPCTKILIIDATL